MRKPNKPSTPKAGKDLAASNTNPKPNKPQQNNSPAKPNTPATAANTIATSYLDTFNKSPQCTKNREKIEEKCKPEPAQTEAEKKDGKSAKKNGLMARIGDTTHIIDELGRKASNYKRTDANAWVDSHCNGMWYKPTNLKNASEEFNNAVKGSLNKLKDEKWGLLKDSMGELNDIAKAKAGAAAEKKIAGLIARSVAKNVVGGAAVVATAGTVGDILEVAMLAWTVTDVLGTAEELAAMAGEEGAAVLANVQDSVDIQNKVESILKEYEDKPDKALADAMRVMSKLNRCLRAKRCALVPMKNTSAKKAAHSGSGCCPGQTGHHLLPQEMFKRKIDKIIPGDLVKSGPNKGNEKTESINDPDNCAAYTNSMHDNAPVVCVEGTNNTHASHGMIHDKIDALMQRHREKNLGKDSITNDEAIDAAVKSHNETFKPACNPECLRAQLHDYYDKLCVGQLKPRGGKAGDIEKDDEGEVIIFND